MATTFAAVAAAAVTAMFLRKHGATDSGEESKAVDRSLFTVPSKVSVAQLKVDEAFSSLTDKEKKYAHYIGTAAWEGAKICLLQASWETPGIFQLLTTLFHGDSAATLAAKAIKAGVSEEDTKAFLAYCATFLSNLGNYKSFGDSKFVPSVSKDVFLTIIRSGVAYAEHRDRVESLLELVGDAIFSLKPRETQLGFGPDEGVSTYYSSNVTKADVELVAGFMEERTLSPYNTRLFKSADGVFQLRIASSAGATGSGKYEDGSYEYKGVTIQIKHGDYGPLMDRIAANLNAAKEFAANDEQRNMLAKYVASFSGGSIDDHKEGSRYWIRDKGPVVESYIGFIESYRDPFGVRGEWEGFVAVVNKITSAKFTELVESAESLLKLLPWTSEFEKDSFLRPDFTSLEVIAFGSSGIPGGINIPNYDDIRQSEGFKNVSLGNVLSARDMTARVGFVADADQDVFRGYVMPAFEVQVGLHELLGHGSGKLFNKTMDGGSNFPDTLINPLTDKPVESWYAPGQTWDSVFSTVASSYEECRAECVGMYLCVNERVLKIFGHEGEEANKIVYANWLSMARAGLLALQVYNPKTKQWGQAHMQARYAILQVMLQSGAAELVGTDAVDAAAVAKARGLMGDDTGASELGVYVRVHEDKIRSHGVPAIGKFLQRLQVYKATADLARGKGMYDEYTTVPDSLLPVRDLLLLNRKPRGMFVQPVTSAVGDTVKLSTFAASVEGIVDSFMARYPAVDDDLMALWKADLEATRV